MAPSVIDTDAGISVTESTVDQDSDIQSDAVGLNTTGISDLAS